MEMCDFTKKDLYYILSGVSSLQEVEGDSAYVYNLSEKIKYMINNLQEVDEKEIHSCETGLAVSDDFFCEHQEVDEDYLFHCIHELAKQSYGMIKQGGIYSFKLRLVKIK